MQVRHRIREMLQKHAHDIYLIHARSGREFTFAQFWAAAGSVAGELASRGVGKGDRVALVLGNSPELCAFYFACLQLGAVAVPVGQSLSEDEVRKIISGLGAKLIVHTDDLPEQSANGVDRWHAAFGNDGVDQQGRSLLDLDVATPALTDKSFAAIDDDNIFTITFTSGTTGLPKGVAHRVRTIFNNAVAFNELVGLDADNRMLHILPMTYIAGILNTLMSPFIAGGSVVLTEPFNAMSAMRFWDPVIANGANTMWISPSIANAVTMVDRNPQAVDYCRDHMRQIFIGTAPLPHSVKQAFESKYGVELLESYGSSEHLFLTANSPRYPRVQGAVGRFLDGIEFRLTNEEGEPAAENEGAIVLKTPFFMAGYLNIESGEIAPSVARDWLEIGDIGRLDDAGNLFIVGRVKDLIIRGGMNISPRAIEDVISGCALVQDVAVVGIPDRNYGEKIVAAIKLAATVDEGEALISIRQWCKSRLPPDRMPSDFVPLEAFPLNANGKLKKDAIREFITKGGAAEAPSPDTETVHQ